MKFLLKLSLLFFVTFSFLSFAHKTTMKITNDDIIAIIETINKNEIAAAKVALSKHVDNDVKDYAAYLNREHTHNLDKTIKISKQDDLPPQNNPIQTKLKREGLTELKMLKPLKGSKFEVTYINAMVKDHQGALKLIDEKLLPSVSNPTLRHHVIATRSHVAMHLEKALKIQKELQTENR